MKEVIVAKSAGFCFGVQRAVDTVYNQCGGKNVFTYGPIIHNEEVVKDLENKGVHVINSADEINDDSTVIIRSHGVSKDVYDSLHEKNVNIVDATCPFVLKIHKIVKEESANGSQIVIIGNENHPEVEGIMGWSLSDTYVIDTSEKAQNLVLDSQRRVCIVSQTTFNYNKFQELVEIIKKKGYDISVLDTICNATEERQTEARKIAAESDLMIVIGDKHSSNTQKLYEISKKECANTYYIQTSKDMDYHQIQSINNVGITAGASTPNNIIEEVSKNVRKFCRDVRGIN